MTIIYNNSLEQDKRNIKIKIKLLDYLITIFRFVIIKI